MMLYVSDKPDLNPCFRRRTNSDTTSPACMSGHTFRLNRMATCASVSGQIQVHASLAAYSMQMLDVQTARLPTCKLWRLLATCKHAG